MANYVFRSISSRCLRGWLPAVALLSIQAACDTEYSIKDQVTGVTPPETVVTTETYPSVTTETADTGYSVTTTLSTCADCDPAAAPFGAGAGTDVDPWLICDALHLDEVRDYSGDDFKMCADVDLTGENYLPVTVFTGTFDGNNYGIENWTYTDQSTSAGQRIALFRVVDGGTIRQLYIRNPNVSIHSASAVLVHDLMSGSLVEDVHVSDAIISGLDGHLAGVVATVRFGATIQDASFSGQVSNDTGGFVGGMIDSCSGLCTRLLAEGSVTSNSWKTSGLVQSINGGTVSNSVSRMTVTGDNRVGGLIAVMNGGVLEDSYFEGDVSGTFWIAGLVAETWSTANPLVQRSYASGTVTAASSMWGIQGSGLVAYDATGVVVVDAGWDTQTTTQMSTSGSGTAMTTAEMQTPTHATFTNWGLPWVLVAGDYPRLDWE